MAKFYISAVRYSNNTNSITHVMAHIPSGPGRIYKGEEYSKSDIISAIQKGHSFTTTTFNYSRGTWSEGANVSIVHINGGLYLRSDADKTDKDNLGHLLPIDELR